MVNPQKKPRSPEKKSIKSLKKFLPQLSSMAKKEGLNEERNNNDDDDKPREAIKVDTILSVFKDEKVKIKV